MKLPILIIVASVGVGVFLSNISHYGLSSVSFSGLKEDSITAQCAKSVPELFNEFAKQPELAQSSLKRVAAKAIFKQVGIHFCQCVDDDYTTKNIGNENEIVGSLAGLFLKLHFSNSLSREYRQQLKAEGQNIFLENQSAIRNNPNILNGTESIFEGCRKKQQQAIRSVTG